MTHSLTIQSMRILMVACTISVACFTSFTFAEGVPANGPIAGTVIHTIENPYAPGTSHPLGSSTVGDPTVLIGTGGPTCSPYVQTFNSLGSRGEEVVKLQKFLNQYDAAQIPVTGYFGEQTYIAVQNFQKRYGIVATGNQFILTTTKINDLFCAFGGQSLGVTPTVKSTTMCPVLLPHDVKIGARDASVAQLQQFMNAYTGAGLPVTGMYGQHTEATVRAFQKKNALAPLDGSVQGATREKINQLFCAYGGTQTRVSPAIFGSLKHPTNVVARTLENPTVVVTQNDTAKAPGTVLGDAVTREVPQTSSKKTWYALLGLAGIALIAYTLQKRKGQA